MSFFANNICTKYLESLKSDRGHVVDNNISSLSVFLSMFLKERKSLISARKQVYKEQPFKEFLSFSSV